MLPDPDRGRRARGGVGHIVDLRALKFLLARASVGVRVRFVPLAEETRERIAVLSYHRVLPGLRDGPWPTYTVFPEHFAAQLALLREEGFVSLSLAEYFEIACGQRPAPARAVLLTFDDGFADTYSIAWRIARHYGITLNVFVCTGLVAGDQVPIYSRTSPEAERHRTCYPELWRALRWSEVREMLREGCGIGLHSHTHRILSSMGAAEIRADIAESIRQMSEHLQQQPTAFAFPKGGPASYHKSAIDELTRAGLKMLFTTSIGRTALPTSGPLFRRISIHQQDSIVSFRRKLLGAYDWIGDVLAGSARKTMREVNSPAAE